MNLTKVQADTLKSAHASGAVEIMKQIAMEQIQDLRASRIRHSNNEDTLWNLAESIGAEKILLHFFTSLHEKLERQG